ncbi:hypothetical protein [Nitrospirillum iridis]|uniref:YfhO family protein n=1 Tax=Nitrospirillum iridis TaxID=765888 RepID=A0A7X0EFN5_9PROT|nr:hypothetical protein [Nitrospirillum iridis]MBB6254175.1 hypothetical protein [Nitrospirillum iridis]
MGLSTPWQVRWPVLSLVAAPLLAKLHLLLGLLKASPLLFNAGLTPHVTTGWLGTYPTIDPNMAFTAQALGRGAVKGMLSGGHLPWWNPYQGVGAPLAGEMQSAALFPPSLLLVLPNGQLYMHLLLQIIAGIATYFLLRRLDCPRAAALAGGLLFQFNGTYAWLATATINPICFLPVMLLGVEVARTCATEGPGALPGDPWGGPKSGRWGGWGWIGTGLALSLYAGFPEVAYFNGLLAAAWTLARLSGLDRSRRLSFLARVAVGVVAGLTLAAPILIAFFDYLPQAYLAQHGASFLGRSLPADALVKVFFPYLHGLIYENGAATAPFWNDVGGYAGLLPVALALYALFGRTRQALRLTLASWIAVTVAACYGLPGLDRVLSILPGFAISAFYRYLPCTWEFALCALAALALADLMTLAHGERQRAATAFWIAGGASAALLAAAFAVPQPAAIAALATPWHGRSLALGVVLLAGWVWCRPRAATDTATSAKVLGTLMVMEAVVYFILPTLAYPSGTHLETAGIHFLRGNLGLQRFYTLGPIEPNYGTYFHVAELNHNDLPLPAKWVRFADQRLDDNAADGVFAHQRRLADGPTAAENFLKNQAAYESVGVKYLATTPETDPFVRAYADVADPTANTPLKLESGQHAGLTLTDPALAGATLNGLSIVVGTGHGYADGVLAATVCSQGQCAIGRGSLKGAIDNHPFTIPLTEPLPLGSEMTVELNYDDALHMVALWSWPRADDGRVTASYQGQALPDRTLKVQLDLAGQPRRVFQDAAMRLYELPNPRPYFTADGCLLAPQSRYRLVSNCPVPTALTRLELSMPGWRATVNGHKRPVTETEGLFQQVMLPAGMATVSFRFLPPYMPLGYGLFALGWVLLALTLGNPLRAWHPASARRATGAHGGTAPEPAE